MENTLEISFLASEASLIHPGFEHGCLHWHRDFAGQFGKRLKTGLFLRPYSQSALAKSPPIPSMLLWRARNPSLMLSQTQEFGLIPPSTLTEDDCREFTRLSDCH